jgi:hypothetical protein
VKFCGNKNRVQRLLEGSRPGLEYAQISVYAGIVAAETRLRNI